MKKLLGNSLVLVLALSPFSALAKVEKDLPSHLQSLPSADSADYEQKLDDLHDFLRITRRKAKRNKLEWFTSIVANVGSKPIKVTYIDSSRGPKTDMFANALNRAEWGRIKPGEYKIMHERRSLADVYLVEKDSETASGFDLILRRDGINVIRNGANISKLEMEDEQEEKRQAQVEKRRQKQEARARRKGRPESKRAGQRAQQELAEQEAYELSRQTKTGYGL